MLRFGKLQSEGLRSFLYLCNMLAFRRNAVNGSISHVFHLVTDIEGFGCGIFGTVFGLGYGRMHYIPTVSYIFDSVAISTTIAYHFDG